MTKKTCDEPWKWDGTERIGWERPGYNHYETLAEFFGPDASPRARLAAQAPAMARMLLEMSEVVIQDGPCPICGWFEESYHAPDCKLIALLKNAGVIE